METKNFKKIFKSKKVRLIVLLSLCLGSALGLIMLHDGKFLTFKELFTLWDDDYYSDTTKIIFLGSVMSAISTAFSSATIQNLNGNPIASSSTLGIGAAGSFGYMLSNWFKIHDYYFVMIVMLAASVIPVVINYLMIKFNKGSKANAILVGLAISALLGTVNYILKKSMGMSEGTLLFMGNSTGFLKWDKIWYCVPMLVVGLFILLLNFKKINIISYSKELASKQNVNFDKVFFWTSIGNLLVITSLTFFMGEIAFLGIIGTNLVRMLIKSNSTWKLAAASTLFNLVVIFIAQWILETKQIDVDLTIVIMSLPIFFYVIFGRKTYA